MLQFVIPFVKPQTADTSGNLPSPFPGVGEIDDEYIEACDDSLETKINMEDHSLATIKIQDIDMGPHTSRALNQALGRCLRHKYDWGALLLVDDRFQKGGYNFKSLSKMTREHLKYFTNWSETCKSLSYFIEKHSCTSH
uniref:ATP-dependent helicase C-terminal domain-containing protein n=1 Tax=Timema genevievae TaxID=629358 RepID=A0A7R9JUN1_TIMGE|nr:unnamed protein product [Timema genevievae]